MTDTSPSTVYRAWGQCDECGFQGLVEYRHVASEDYDDDEALGVMMDASCPSCGFEESVLMIIDEYRAMLRLAESGEE